MFRQIGILSAFIFMAFVASAQDTLPAFTLLNKGNNRIVTSWTNAYRSAIKQLTIQRSFDSTKNFTSILTVPDPTVPQNGYVDTKATNDHMFYRLYILLDSGRYIFSKSKRPVPDTIKVKPVVKESKAPDQRIQEEPKPENKKPVTEDIKAPEPEKKEIIKPKEIPERIIYIKKRDTLIAQIGERSLKHFKDSLSVKTKDTLSFSTADTIVIKPFVPREVYKPSKYVFTEKDGNVKITLADAATKKYTLKFFDENNVPVFEIKQIKDNLLILDKANFLHSGWFKFELLEDGQLKEKHKLFIPKDF
jgi:hypothetical protein